MQHCSDRKEQIIETAQKYFAQYGFEKTTMQEIADDLNISKGSLYYYFPDKEDLYRAIVVKEKDEFLKTLSTECKLFVDPLDMLSRYAKIRFELTTRMFNLARSKTMYLFKQNFKPLIKTIMEELNQREIEIIEKILSKGVEGGYFSIETSRLPEMASLFNDVLTGMRIFYLRDKHIFLTDEETEVFKNRVDLFLKVFCRGLQSDNK